VHQTARFLTACVGGSRWSYHGGPGAMRHTTIGRLIDRSLRLRLGEPFPFLLASEDNFLASQDNPFGPPWHDQ
jgi:hypothetical protein